MNRPMDPKADRDYWLQRIASAQAVLEQMDRQTQVDLLPRMQTEFELALMLAFIHPSETVRLNEHLGMALDCACSLALGRVCAQRGSGFVIELRRGERGWQLPAGASDFAWPHWLSGFSLALLSGREERLAILATPDCIDACAIPMGQVDRFWPLFCAGMAAMYQRDDLAVELFDDAMALLTQAEVVDPALLEQVYRPAMLAARALAGGDASQIRDQLGVALQSKHNYYAEHLDATGDPLTLFDIVLSGLNAEARRRGVEQLPDSDYLLPSTPGNRDAAIICRYPRLSILSAREAEWFLQNEGFCRHDRSVVTNEEHGVLVANYRAYDAPGIPLADVGFELLECATTDIYAGRHAVPALDVGELLYRAERLASEPHAGDDGESVYDLPQAVEALDLMLAYLSVMPGGFRPDTLHSGIGRKLYEEEPGRFRVERVQVYRNALARQVGIAEIDVDLHSSSVVSDPKHDVLALIDELKPLVLPVLQELALDQTGEAMRQLLPQPLDYERAFIGEAVDVAREYYDRWWREQGNDLNIDASDVVDVYLVPAGMLATDNELSYQFPRGYRDIAPWLQAHRIWVSWRYRQPGETSGIALNGLVWLDDHWAWFPKPYHLVDRIQRH